MSEIKVKTKSNNDIDFSSLDEEVMQEKKIQEKTEQKDESDKKFKPDMKLWTIAGIAAVVIIVACVVFLNWPTA